MDACAPLNTTGTGPVIDEPIGTERELGGGGREPDYCLVLIIMQHWKSLN